MTLDIYTSGYLNEMDIPIIDHISLDEEIPEPKKKIHYLCKCLIDEPSSEQIVISERKKQILSTVTRTESYLRERRIPELIRFLLTKIILHGSQKPMEFLEKLLDDCMLFRAGHGAAPVLYEIRHLEAVVKSFDPGRRGWLTSGQVRRAFTTLGLTPPDILENKISCDVALNLLRKTQESELFNLLSAGRNMEDNSEDSKSGSSM